MSATGKRFRQFLKYLGLVGLTTVLTVALAWQDSPSRMGILEVNAAIPDTSVVQVSPPDAVELVQVGLQRYQLGEFAAAITTWQQAADIFASQGDSLNQAMVLSNLALAYQQLGKWTSANQAIEKSLHLLQTETASRDRTTDFGTGAEYSRKAAIGTGTTGTGAENLGRGDRNLSAGGR